ncbi:MAG: hypothetical protein M3Y33_18010 [Actinomycetota bacterium]|nr:hypothetical protein [Actinomycetota bacterium]
MIVGDHAVVQRAQVQQAARDRVVMEARQDELKTLLASLSEQARQLEASTARRINTATAAIMTEAQGANRQLRAETRQLLDRQQERLDTALATEREARQREASTLSTEIERDRAVKASVLESALTAVADARVLRDAIGSSLPHRALRSRQARPVHRPARHRRGERRSRHG